MPSLRPGRVLAGPGQPAPVPKTRWTSLYYANHALSRPTDTVGLPEQNIWGEAKV